MRFHVLATDYDGTLAEKSQVSKRTCSALERLIATGRKLVLVTGREMADLETVFPQLHYFSWIVAENGGLLFCPATREEKLLATPPPAEFASILEGRGVKSMSQGRVIVATWQPWEVVVLQTIRELGLELQVIFNKGAVMVLPSGVNKATGLKAALEHLHVSPNEVVGVGDAENDHAFLRMCECSVAVANALPALKQEVDVVTQGDHGTGVVELIDELISSDLAAWESKIRKHRNG